MIKSSIKSCYYLLKKYPLVRKIRYSKWGWKIFFTAFPEIRRIVKKEYHLYEKIFANCDGKLAFDIGSNLGLNTLHLLRLGLRVVAVEPESENFEALSIRFSQEEKVFLENIAVSESKGLKTMYKSNTNALHTLSEKWSEIADDKFTFEVRYEENIAVNVLSLEDLIKKYGVPEILKVDVEGHEREVFKGLKTPISRITFEANLPEFKLETMEIIRYLLSLNNRYQFAFYPTTLNFYNSIKKIKSVLQDINQSVEVICLLEVKEELLEE